MLQRTYVIFLIIYILYNKTTSCFESFYGVRTNEYPKTSCQEIENIKTALRCLGRCGSTIDNIVMISHNESTNTYMCCNDVTGSDIIGANWNSFVLGKSILVYLTKVVNANWLYISSPVVTDFTDIYTPLLSTL